MIENPEKNEAKRIKSYSGQELMASPELLEMLEMGRRVFIKFMAEDQERSGIVGVITGFQPETKTLSLSPGYGGREKFFISLDKIVEITFL